MYTYIGSVSDYTDKLYQSRRLNIDQHSQKQTVMRAVAIPNYNKRKGVKL